MCEGIDPDGRDPGIGERCIGQLRCRLEIIKGIPDHGFADLASQGDGDGIWRRQCLLLRNESNMLKMRRFIGMLPWRDSEGIEKSSSQKKDENKTEEYPGL